MAAKKYVVVAPFVGTLTRGDIVTADQLPSEAKAHIEDGSVREATPDEVKAGWLEYTDKKGNPVLTPTSGAGAPAVAAPTTAPATPAPATSAAPAPSESTSAAKADTKK